jgi:uncharacterized membrane protein (UPF0127 family)
MDNEPIDQWRLGAIAFAVICTGLWMAFTPKAERPEDRTKHLLQAGGKATMVVGGEPQTVDLLTVEADIARGFAGTLVVPRGEGKLFVLPPGRKAIFWMKGCLTDLDMVFLDGAMMVQRVDTALLEPSGTREEDFRRYTPLGPMTLTQLALFRGGPMPVSRYVLELGPGEAKRLGLKVGDVLRLDFPKDKTQS